MFKVSRLNMTLVLVAVASTGCGGGGGDGSSSEAPTAPTAAPPTSFNLAAARQAWVTNGLNVEGKISGNTLDGVSLSGTADFDESPASSATVNGQPAEGQTLTVTGTVNGGVYSSSEVDYFTTGDEDLIESSPGDFDVAQSPFVYPSMISIGDTGVLGMFNAYSDDTEVLPLGTKQVTYVVKANPADPNTAIFAVLTQYSFATGTFTDEDDYTITASGVGSTLIRSSVQQEFLGAQANLVFQAN